jgi:uncharacterized protein
MRRIAALFAVVAVAGATSYFRGIPFDVAAMMGPPADRYTARSIVTGQRDETRLPGFERALVDALRKVSGDPSISPDKVQAAVGGKIVDYVKGYAEHDRMEGIPIHDEQGTRDRPFDLTVDFHPEKIDALLKTLGNAAWTGNRPRTLVLLAINTDAISYILTSDEDRGIDQRDSLTSAAWQAGLPLLLPSGENLTASTLKPANLMSASQDMIGSLKHESDAERVMLGSITWKSGMTGWQAEWQFANKNITHNWQIRDVNFDEAFRSALWGEAQILSGHGRPDL